jgi:hypothetical protein
MADKGIATTIVNHVAIDIAAPAEAVWAVILEEYVETKKFREAGYAIEPIDDPGALLGGYRMRLEKDGAVIDDRICLFSERDDAARRLSLYADYLSAPNGLQVFATYHAQQTAGGARYALDCHTRMAIDAPASGTKADFAAAVEEMKTHFHTALASYLESMKARLEAKA